jgi:hypothetical protein
MLGRALEVIDSRELAASARGESCRDPARAAPHERSDLDDLPLALAVGRELHQREALDRVKIAPRGLEPRLQREKVAQRGKCLDGVLDGHAERFGR